MYNSTHQQGDLRGLSVQGEKKFNSTLTTHSKAQYSKIGSMGGTLTDKAVRGKSVNMGYSKGGYEGGSSSKWARQFEALRLDAPKIMTFKR